MRTKLLAGSLFILVFSLAARAQTTEFVYQGQLQNASAPANGSFDFEFLLFDALSGGTQVGSTQTRSSVNVANGIFTVKLDFGSNYPGANRFLEVHVRQTGPGGFQQLLPRQTVASAPYSVRSLNAENADTSENSTQLGGIAVTGFIQNTVTPQTASLNISGNGTVGGTLSGNAVNAATEYDIAGLRVLKTTASNLFVGVDAGAANTTGNFNSFVGTGAGTSNTTGLNNSFFGSGAGLGNTTGQGNSFFGLNSGKFTTNGNFNSFFGLTAGQSNGSGSSNSFFGSNNGVNNTTGSFNTFVGDSAGFSNTTASGNSFFGYQAGKANTTAGGNSFFGELAGQANTTAAFNSFFGFAAGNANTTGAENSLFGYSAGVYNTTGTQNSMFGTSTGTGTTTGSGNSMFGRSAGNFNTTGSGNSYFGLAAGQNNVTGSNNSIFGILAGLANTGDANSFFGAFSGRNATSGFNSFFGFSTGLAVTTGFGNSFFGYNSGIATTAGCCNAFFGSSSGASNTTGGNNAFFGTDIGTNNTTGSANVFVGNSAGGNNTTGSNNVFLGRSSGSSNTTESSNTFVGVSTNGAAGITNSTAIGANAQVSASNTMVLGDGNASYVVDVTGKLQIDVLGTAGATALCLNGSGRVATCSSSLRYKTNIGRFSSGLAFVNKMHPISFDWKDGGMKDVGFAAEDVAKIDPRFVTYNKNGEVEGVKYDRLGVVLVNSVKEQQAQIESLEKQNLSQQKQIEALTQALCSLKPAMEVCKPKE